MGVPREHVQGVPNPPCVTSRRARGRPQTAAVEHPRRRVPLRVRPVRRRLVPSATSETVEGCLDYILRGRARPRRPRGHGPPPRGLRRGHVGGIAAAPLGDHEGHVLRVVAGGGQHGEATHRVDRRDDDDRRPQPDRHWTLAPTIRRAPAAASARTTDRTVAARPRRVGDDDVGDIIASVGAIGSVSVAPPSRTSGTVSTRVVLANAGISSAGRPPSEPPATTTTCAVHEPTTQEPVGEEPAGDDPDRRAQPHHAGERAPLPAVPSGRARA